MNLREDRIMVVKEAPLSKGKAEYLKWLEGGKLTRKEAMDANCFLCMGYFLDGKVECTVSLCPMRDYMYYNPKRIKGKSHLTVEQRQKAGERLRKRTRSLL